ncbi:hypothetical protein [uncultured Draconibacterium sp.]|uniref:hypothetical protein n=1 Tax=uncultured Draconibacterium sp. TaxID=1573823 RepID=UPI0029C90CFB|nr:hypothetical protein [uncultured Draconibacterium sp.]
MKKKKKQSFAGKIIIGSIALIFFAYGCFLSLLWLGGTKTQASVQNFRREMGERNETIRNQYTYTYDYEFTVSGKTYSGNSKKVKGPLFLKDQGNIAITVHYLPCCPMLNAPTDDFSPWYKILIYFAVTLILGYFLKRMR